MTCREKLKIEHPDKLTNDNWGGCAGCPHTYGYMPRPGYCPYGGNDFNTLRTRAQKILCTECWNREILEPKEEPETAPSEIKPIEQEPRISNMLELLWFVEKVMANGDKMVSVSFDMYPNNISANVYPYPLKKNEGENK